MTLPHFKLQTLYRSGTKMCKSGKIWRLAASFLSGACKGKHWKESEESSKDIIHFDSSPPQRDKKPNMAVCLNLQKRNRCQSWCQHKNRKRSQAPNAPPTAGNAANHRESRAALCLILRCWHLEGNFTSRRCHMVTARRRLAHNFFLPLAKEQIPQSAGYQQLLTILNDHHVLNYLRASPHTAWVGADVGRLQFKWTVVWE